MVRVETPSPGHDLPAVSPVFGAGPEVGAPLLWGTAGGCGDHHHWGPCHLPHLPDAVHRGRGGEPEGTLCPQPPPCRVPKPIPCVPMPSPLCPHASPRASPLPPMSHAIPAMPLVSPCPSLRVPLSSLPCPHAFPTTSLHPLSPHTLLATSPYLFPMSPCPLEHIPVPVLCVPKSSPPCPHALPSPHGLPAMSMCPLLCPCILPATSPRWSHCVPVLSHVPPPCPCIFHVPTPSQWCPHAHSPCPCVLLDTSLSQSPLSPCPYARSPVPTPSQLCPHACSPCPRVLLDTSLSSVPLCPFPMSPHSPHHVPAVSPGHAPLLPQHDQGRGLLREDL